MGTFLLTYSMVWLALILYVVILGIYQRRLSRRAGIAALSEETSRQSAPSSR